MSGEEIQIFVAIAIITFLAGTVHSIIGFGFGIVALALLPFFINAESAHVMMSMCSLPMLLTAAWAYRKGIDWSTLVPAIIGAAIFMPIGLYAFGSMSLDVLVRGTGLAILLTTLFSLRNRKEVQPNGASGSRWMSAMAGALSGLLGGAVSIAGPPVATFALKQGWPPERFKAFVTQCLLVVCFYKVVGLGVGGWINNENLVQAAWATPFSMIGIQVGVAASRRIDANRFQLLVAIVLIAISCLMMFRGQPD